MVGGVAFEPRLIVWTTGGQVITGVAHKARAFGANEPIGQVLREREKEAGGYGAEPLCAVFAREQHAECGGIGRIGPCRGAGAARSSVCWSARPMMCHRARC